MNVSIDKVGLPVMLIAFFGILFAIMIIDKKSDKFEDK